MDTLNYEHHLVIETKSSHHEHGRKIYASYEGKRVSASWDYSLDPNKNHERAVLKWLNKHEPEYKIKAYGSTKNGYVFLVR